MARYDVECEPCGQTDEVVKSYKDPAPDCPICGGPRRVVILQALATKLRGSGWAADGYSHTELGDRATADTADRRGAISSFPGQKNHSRIPQGDEGT